MCNTESVPICALLVHFDVRANARLLVCKHCNRRFVLDVVFRASEAVGVERHSLMTFFLLTHLRDQHQLYDSGSLPPTHCRNNAAVRLPADALYLDTTQQRVYRKLVNNDDATFAPMSNAATTAWQLM